MSNPLQDKIMKLVEPMFERYVQPAKGTVKDYSKLHHMAQVEIDNPYGLGKMLLPQVPVGMTGGMHSVAPKLGDEVWVAFTGGKITLPKIVSQADRDYEMNTREKKMKHKKQGAYVPEIMSKR